MIDLAPTSKRGLELNGPLIIAGGYGHELDGALISHVHALVTNPTTLRPRIPPRDETRLVQFAGGVLYARGGANPGLAAVLQANRHAWRRLRVPIILSLASEDMIHWPQMAARISRVESISALELEFGEVSDASEAIGLVKRETDLPIIAKIPLDRAQERCEEAISSGADALTVGLAPLGYARIHGTTWEGRLGGPPLKPIALREVTLLAQVDPAIPLIAAGGVETAADVLDLLQAGARAVQIDTALWRDPNSILEICC
jgi:dihydroorotate dehydrogenase (NAD+) catalytic subunit